MSFPTYNKSDKKANRIMALKSLLGNNERWAVRGLLAIYKYQTEEEKDIQATTEHNGVGFTGADGDILSSFAEQVQKGRTMSPKQMALIFKKMPKYAVQLDRVVQST